MLAIGIATGKRKTYVVPQQVMKAIESLIEAAHLAVQEHADLNCSLWSPTTASVAIATHLSLNGFRILLLLSLKHMELRILVSTLGQRLIGARRSVQGVEHGDVCLRNLRIIS
jgi:hypothetical protein